MEPADRAELEEKIRAALAAGDRDAAVTLALRGYGPEVLGFLCAQERDEARAHEAFAQLGEDLWQGVAAYAHRSSFRTWMYAVARAALHRTRRDAGRREKRLRPMAAWEEAAEQVRSATAVILRTETKDRFAALRDALPPEDRELLVLRVDRGMEWSDLARVLGERDDLEGEALKRESARLRKRFQLVKDRLREMAEREGLLDPG